MDNKVNIELVWAEIFCSYINERFAWDYQMVAGGVFKIPENYPDIDVVLVSPSGKENLFLQLRRDLKDIEFINIDGKRTPFFSAGEIEHSINEKQKKYEKQGRDIRNVILLIQGGGIPYLEMKLWMRDVCIPKNTFRGIYYISPRSLMNEQFVFSALGGF